MAGIPGPLLRPIREALLACDQLYSQRELLAVFVAEDLRMWRDGLPEASSANQRVDFTIDYLFDKHNTSGDNGLVLLLRVLGERHDPADDRRPRLLALAGQLAWLLRRPPRPVATREESNPAGAGMLFIGEAERMLACARSVARVEVPRFRAGAPAGVETGTAWLIAPALALTCRHVLAARGPLDAPAAPEDLRMQIGQTLLTFDYTAAGKGLQYQVQPQGLEYPPIQAHGLDYAVLRLTDRADAPLRDRGYLRLDRDAPLTAQTSLYIIQHPLGQAQQVAGDTFERLAPAAGRILYRTPTEPGTSGAPVFNRASWRVVALHNGENVDADLREGTLIKAILEDIERHHPDLHREIAAAQSVKE